MGKTWKSLLGVCRSAKSGRFASKARCKMFKRSKVRRAPRSKGRQFQLFS